MVKANNAAIARAKKLRDLITHHKELYHTHDAPEISDEAYDALVLELEDLEATYPALRTSTSPTVKVGGRPSDAFKKVEHSIKQWSFDNVFDETELRAWEGRVLRGLEAAGVDIRGLAYVCEQKIDGLKIVLEYKKGVLFRAATRGDGVIGEDVTHTAKTIKDIPHVLASPVSLIAVGEVWFPKKDFERTNKERVKQGEPPFANPRNAAAGSLRQLDASVTASRNLHVFIYDLDMIDVSGTTLSAPSTQFEELALLKKLGFTTNRFNTIANDIEGVLAYYRTWAPKKHEEQYGMDGVVVKVNRILQQRALGYTAKAPRFGVAFKFPSEQATTLLEDIALQVGRTGVVTPVAHLRPVLIAGSTVSRATLHNEDQIRRLDVRVGDTVILQKAGDVIPEILGIIPELRPKGAKPYAFPKKVAECGGDGSIERIPGTAAYRCVARDSDALHRARLYYFAGKHAFNIDGMGEKIIDALLDQGLVNSYADFFTLTEGDALMLPHFKETAARNLLRAIERARSVTLYRLLVGLSIEHVGSETARVIANHFKTIDAIERASREELAHVYGVGDVVAAALYTWMRDKRKLRELHKLLKEITVQRVAQTEGGRLSGKTVVFTGTLPTLSREEASERARAQGAHVASSVSKKTDYVVVGADAGSKAEHARKFGVTVLTEAQFFELLT